MKMISNNQRSRTIACDSRLMAQALNEQRYAVCQRVAILYN